jgi:8-oxo-dGTP pyrophosphatase MutT (NUDIX family)
MSDRHPLSEKEFWEIYRKVPRLTVEIVVRKDNAVLLTKRSIEPCSGLWHLPGGTVRFGEPLEEAVRRISQRELGIIPGNLNLLGYIEYPSHYNEGLDSPVGIAFDVLDYNDDFHFNRESGDAGWFQALPDDMHQEQKIFLGNHLASNNPRN